MRSNRWHIFLFALTALLLTGCTFPFTTATYKWKIKFDKDKIAFKENWTKQELPAYSGERLPNILFIVVDDLGKYEVSAYGSETMHTPNIDQLSREGVRFTDCYVSAPICAPSRAGLLTGRYPVRYGFETQPMEVYPNNLAAFYAGKYLVNTGDFVMDVKPKFPPEWEMIKQGIPPSEFTLAEVLKMRGYATGCIGKWHLGLARELIPNSRGFDYQYGFYGAFSLYSKSRNSPNMVNHVQDAFSSKHQWKMGRKETSAIRKNDKVIREDRYLTFAIRDEAVEYMARNRDNPFFLYLAFNAPHVPFQAPRVYYEMHGETDDENKRVYYSMIHALDDAIGDLMEKLELLGLEENTLIYLISDNGGASYTGATDNGPYKGGKITMFEGGVNVPFIMKWKGHIPEGMVYEHPVSSLDIFMTTAALTECPLPRDRVYDGVDLMPYLTGEEEGIPHEVFYWKADHIHAMRKGGWKYLLSTRDKWIELYNIAEDKYEKINLYLVNPEILDEMQEGYKEWLKGTVPPLWPRVMDHRFIIDGKEYLFPA
ncbi:MAG: sulfatase-like hydrolase/transferase [Bacteroidales bacterium]